MRTDKQIEASRINGAKSQGPKTPEGKAKSAQNGNRHNLAGGHIVLLSNESPDEFIAFCNGYLDAFAPANFVERDLVNQLIAASWRLARISAMESAIIEVEMWRQEPKHAETFDFLDSHTRHVLTFLNMDNEEDGMRKLQRYQTAARRAYNAAFKQLQALQGDRFDRQPTSLPEAVSESTETEPQPEQEPSTAEAKVTAFTPRNTKLQSEPELFVKTAKPVPVNRRSSAFIGGQISAPPLTMCA
jgi:hypothetical protein